MSKTVTPSLLLAAALFACLTTACRTARHDAGASGDERAEVEIRRIYDQEQENLLRMDIVGQDRLLPDDFVVTNPFGMFIDKREVIERLQANIIKYSRYDREFDDFRRYGEVMIVIGKETVVPTMDANRPDAGKTVTRRFTEVWVHRHGRWEKVARHANNLGEAQ